MRIATTTLDYYNSYLYGTCYRCRGNGTCEVNNGEDVIVCPACGGTGAYMEIEKFINSLKVCQEPTRKMVLGERLHELIENPVADWIRTIRLPTSDGGSESYIDCGEFTISVEDINKIISDIDYRFPFETKVTPRYNINGEDVVLVSKVDQIVGQTIYEKKFTFGQYDYERYAKSVQWKCYCLAFGVDKVAYAVHIMADGKHSVKLRDIRRFNMFSYAGMDIEIMNLLKSFVEFIHSHKLEEYFSNSNKVMIDDL